MTRPDTVWQSIRGSGTPRINGLAGAPPRRALGMPKCYTITSIQMLKPMTEHSHHHHPHGHAHPPAAIAPSILRLSVVQRLLFAALLTALVWTAVILVMG